MTFCLFLGFKILSFDKVYKKETCALERVAWWIMCLISAGYRLYLQAVIEQLFST